MVSEEERLAAAAPPGIADRARALTARLGCSAADTLALGVLVAGAIAALGLLWVLAARESGDVSAPPVPGLVTATPTASAPAELVVHVAGHVAVPGVYRLAPADRVGDAVAAAGGTLPGAGLEALNLARPLADGEQIVVPVPGAAAPTVPETATARRPDGRLDLNLADADDLDELPGIGSVLAERILAHRAAIGRFTSIDELRDVKGIGAATFAELAGAVAV